MVKLSVILVWIPTHLGIPGNEKVDFWAKKAISVDQTLYHKLPFHASSNSRKYFWDTMTFLFPAS